jgi:hypothetical protein
MGSRRTALRLATAALLLVSAGCNDEISAGVTDGAKTGDGSGTRDGVTVGDGPKVTDSGGWVVYDGGPVKVLDGGRVITEDGGTQIICYPTTCAGKLLECGDCIDNDGDGKVDWRDPECLGPCDNTEGPALIAGVGGATGSSCGVDCYFDYGNGPGNDDCFWDHRCDPLQPEATCPYDGNMVGATDCPAQQSKQCNDYCIPYTPNGCDCFGCCTFPALAGKGPNGGPGYVWIGAFDDKKQGTCTFKDVLDPKKCPACTPVQACNNPCGLCEVCVGKPMPPPECFQKPPDGGATGDGTGKGDGGGTSLPGQCASGVQPCGLPGQVPCPPTRYCISGCCIPVQID